MKFFAKDGTNVRLEDHTSAIATMSATIAMKAAELDVRHEPNVRLHRHFLTMPATAHRTPVLPRPRAGRLRRGRNTRRAYRRSRPGAQAGASSRCPRPPTPRWPVEGRYPQPAAAARHFGHRLPGRGGASGVPTPPRRSKKKRFSVQQKMAIVARLLRGEPLELVARETNVSIARLTEWRDRALAGSAERT